MLTTKKPLIDSGWRNYLRHIADDPKLVLFAPSGLDGNVIDYSGTGNNGTITGATWTRLANGLWGLYFDGNDDVLHGNGASLQITGAMATEVWVKSNGAIAATSTIISKDTVGAAAERGYVVSFDSTGKLYFTIFNTGTAYTALNPAESDDSLWHHVLGIYIPSTSVTLWVDGVQVAQNVVGIPASITNATANVYLGRCDSVGTPRYLTGWIDLARIYNVSSVTSHFQQERSFFGM